MTKKELELAVQNAEIRGDIQAMRSAIMDLLKTFGIGSESMEKDKHGNDTVDVPKILGKLSRKVLMNDFNDQSIKNLIAVLPIMNKYASDDPVTKPAKPKRKW